MLTPEEIKKIREIVWAKRVARRDPELLDELGIKMMGKLTHLCAPPELGEVRIPDPFGDYLGMTEETARKILVLGL